MKNNFGIIRLLGAIMVIIGHMYVLTGQTPPMIMWNVVHGMGVAIFFCIGGYLVTLSWLRQPNFGQYIVKRVFRIFPALIVCVLFTVFIIGPLATSLPAAEYFRSSLIWKYLANCLLYINYKLPGMFENNIWGSDVNGSLWCLPVEFLMYIATPVYIGIGTKIPARVQKYYYGISALLVIVAASVWTTWFYDICYFVSHNLQIMPYYFVGSVIAVCKLERFLSAQTAIVVMITAAGLAYLPPPFCYAAQYVLIPYVILSLALEEFPVFTVFNKCNISYGMFLFAFVIQQILVQVFVNNGYQFNIWILSALAIIISALMGILTERFVERPSGKLCKKILLLIEKRE